MQDVKRKILDLWFSVSRSGTAKFIEFLEKSDFFEAPCSTQHHLNCPGGLAEHSLNVYYLLLEKKRLYQLSIDNDSLIICGLGHDLCKVNFYTKALKNRKIEGKWVEEMGYVVNDKLPLGHGEKSISILQNFIALTDEEKLVIRWHMGSSEPATHFFYPAGAAFRNAQTFSPLVTLLHTADLEATFILEKDK